MNSGRKIVILKVFSVGIIALAALLLRATPQPSSYKEQKRNAAIAAPSETEAQTALRALLQAQVEAWNRGDVVGFMAGYWKSDVTTFVTSTGILRGWNAVLGRYLRSYPDRAAMGRLTFSNLEITPLGRHAALILGHWQLEREKDRPGGVFTLVARRFPEGWRIIHDHTSAFTPPAASKP